MRTLLYLLLPAALYCASALAAVDTTYTFDDPAKEAQFQELIKELRCPKCQNQDIADSDAELAKDLRDKVYQMTQDGKSRTEIIDYMKARYGDFIHYQPPMRLDTLVLWLAPIMVLVGGLIFIFVRASREQASPLNEEERRRLARILDEEEQHR
ncbi:cytochrome c-type biogenesis protein [Gallaecimonas xiamenensis]|uniref:Cytochrome c-type biogenesis protein n=1 Tax=Gallaecimonas xiamenensis 3-C-1 TaxID=745411 RepID=K2JJA5_9GAMM|nr:cytochrome c-type biogenesis protein [Gallaecimonas xiamenensis]EKE75383.1 cytochrome c heme lyase subunit CcmL [Gallaecimonas xiamenensis 3-C-1]